MTSMRLGEVEIARVVEIPRSSFPTTDMLPTSSKDVIARHAAWLAPFMDAATGDLGSRIQSYVVRTPDETVLIDTCVGNDKTRHEAPIWNMRKGTWLEDLRGRPPLFGHQLLQRNVDIGVTGDRPPRVLREDGRVADIGADPRREGEQEDERQRHRGSPGDGSLRE